MRYKRATAYRLKLFSLKPDTYLVVSIFLPNIYIFTTPDGSVGSVG